MLSADPVDKPVEGVPLGVVLELSICGDHAAFLSTFCGDQGAVEGVLEVDSVPDSLADHALDCPPMLGDQAGLLLPLGGDPAALQGAAVFGTAVPGVLLSIPPGLGGGTFDDCPAMVGVVMPFCCNGQAGLDAPPLPGKLLTPPDCCAGQGVPPLLGPPAPEGDQVEPPALGAATATVLPGWGGDHAALLPILPD